jgi:hypothetical protein
VLIAVSLLSLQQSKTVCNTIQHNKTIQLFFKAKEQPFYRVSSAVAQPRRMFFISTPLKTKQYTGSYTTSIALKQKKFKEKMHISRKKSKKHQLNET